MTVIVDRQPFWVLFERPGKRYHNFETGESQLGFELAFRIGLGPQGQDLEEIAFNNVGVKYATSHVHAVHLFVVETNPFLKIAEDIEGIITQDVTPVVVGTQTAKLHRHDTAISPRFF